MRATARRRQRLRLRRFIRARVHDAWLGGYNYRVAWEAAMRGETPEPLTEHASAEIAAEAAVAALSVTNSS